jgi:serine/threonine protein kinase
MLELSPALENGNFEDLPFTDLPNKILLNYKLINFIGEGAFGQVFLVKHISNDK